MMTPTVIGSAGQSTHYYEKDNYYARGDARAQQQSEWVGEGAGVLGLRGQLVNPAVFQSILEGNVPGGKRLGGQLQDGSWNHRPGVDLTFSAPKSVSIMAEIGGDQEVLEAHKQAVKTTLAWFEKNRLQTRVKQGRDVVPAGDQGMVTALFHHNTSRELDPQLHTHAVLANMVIGQDGKWRSVHNGNIWDDQLLVGQVYRSELARRVAALGYTVQQTKENGEFEVREVPRDVQEAFSTRSKQIQDLLSQFGHHNPKTAELANLLTRKSKGKVDQAELHEGWDRQAEAMGFNAREVVAKVRGMGREAEKGGVSVAPGSGAETPDRPSVTRTPGETEQGGAGIVGPGRPAAPGKEADAVRVPGTPDQPSVTRTPREAEQGNVGADGRTAPHPPPGGAGAAEAPGGHSDVRGEPEAGQANQGLGAAVAALAAKVWGFVRAGQARPARAGKDADAYAVAGNGPPTPAVLAVAHAIEHLSQRSSVFSANDVQMHALVHGLGRAGIEEIDAAVRQFHDAGVLVASPSPSLAAKRLLTTSAAIAQEQENIALVAAGAGAGKVLSDPTTTPHPGLTLNDGQAAAIRGVSASRSRVVGVQGFAGVGKTTMFRVLNEAAKGDGHRLMGLAPTNSAAATFAAETGAEAGTMQGFLAKYDGVAHGRLTAAGRKELRGQFAKTIIVLDEGSLASTSQANDFLKIVNELQIPKVIWSGDKLQHGSVDAGKPFAQLQNHMETFNVTEIVRQTNPRLKAAVENAIAGNIDAAFERLGSNIVEIQGQKGSHKIEHAAASTWLAMPEEKRDRTIVVAPANETRTRINREIRAGLRSEGKLAGRAVDLKTLEAEHFTGAQSRAAASYFPGHFVEFQRAYPNLGISKGDLFAVQKSDTTTQTVTLAKDGKAIEWQPLKFGKGHKSPVTVYKEGDVQLQAGDKVMWKTTAKDRGIINSEGATVKAITEAAVTFVLRNGKTTTIPMTDPVLRHVDYAYAVTSYLAQGQTKDTVIGVLESWRRNVVDQASFYVTLSRARLTAVLFTDDKLKLGNALYERTGARISALEHQDRDYAGAKAIGIKPDAIKPAQVVQQQMSFNRGGRGR